MSNMRELNKTLALRLREAVDLLRAGKPDDAVRIMAGLVETLETGERMFAKRDAAPDPWRRDIPPSDLEIEVEVPDDETPPLHRDLIKHINERIDYANAVQSPKTVTGKPGPSGVDWRMRYRVSDGHTRVPVKMAVHDGSGWYTADGPVDAAVAAELDDAAERLHERNSADTIRVDAKCVDEEKPNRATYRNILESSRASDPKKK